MRHTADVPRFMQGGRRHTKIGQPAGVHITIPLPDDMNTYVRIDDTDMPADRGARCILPGSDIDPAELGARSWPTPLPHLTLGRAARSWRVRAVTPGRGRSWPRAGLVMVSGKRTSSRHGRVLGRECITPGHHAGKLCGEIFVGDLTRPTLCPTVRDIGQDGTPEGGPPRPHVTSELHS